MMQFSMIILAINNYCHLSPFTKTFNANLILAKSNIKGYSVSCTSAHVKDNLKYKNSINTTQILDKAEQLSIIKMKRPMNNKS